MLLNMMLGKLLLGLVMTNLITDVVTTFPGPHGADVIDVVLTTLLAGPVRPWSHH